MGISLKWIGWLLIFATFVAEGQDPERKPINLNEFSYRFTGGGLYEQNADSKGSGFGFVRPRVILALNESNVKRMTTSLVSAINDYWGAGIDSTLLIVEPINLNMVGEIPKFKIKLPKKYSDNWEFFLRITDIDRDRFGSKLNPELAGLYYFECKILNGKDGQEIFSRNMNLHIFRKPTPENQFLLVSVPGMAESFLKAFDNAAKKFFSNNPPEFLKLEVEPACLFIDYKTAASIRSTLKFSYSIDRVFVVEGPEMAWVPSDIQREQSGKTKKSGYGVGSGLFSMVTGIDNEKERSKTTPYMTRILMNDEGTGTQYGFHIPTMEIESETVNTYAVREGSSKSFDREVSGGFNSRTLLKGSFITRGNDTIGQFEFVDTPSIIRKDNLRYYWNGIDSNTVQPIPDTWNTLGAYPITAIEGTLYGKPFSIANTKAGNQLDYWYDNLHVATFKVEKLRPTDGILYNADVPNEVLKVLAMFTSLPYGYYGKYVGSN